jgi:predicted RNase H-like HicB family nuclease
LSVTLETTVSVGAAVVPEVLADFDFNTEAVDGVFTGGNAIATVQGDGVELAEGLAGNGTALKLNGTSNSWLKVTDADGNFLLKGLDEFTISYDSNTSAEGSEGAGWAFYAAPNENTQTYKSEKYIGIMDLGGNINVERYNSNNETRPSKTTGSAIDQWKHVDIVFTKESTILYINGVKQDEQSSTVDIKELLGDDGVFYIGKANWTSDGEYFAGLIDNFKIYSSAKTEDEVVEKIETVTTNYVAGENGKITGTATQVSIKGANTTKVTAVANSKYKFVGWMTA